MATQKELENLLTETRLDIASIKTKVDFIYDNFQLMQNTIIETKTVQDSCPARRRNWLHIASLAISLFMMLITLYASVKIQEVQILNKQNKEHLQNNQVLSKIQIEDDTFWND